MFGLQALLTWLIAMPFLAAQGRPNAAMRVQAEGLIDQVSPKEWRNHLVNDLSGGQQQRLALTRALLMRPALLLTDEPTGNVDTVSANKVFTLMRDISRSDTSVLDRHPRPTVIRPLRPGDKTGGWACAERQGHLSNAARR
ncbi:ABC-type lipoprotein export system ATPase subunit [Oxalobacteraceae bacterium GrIS 2.11]|uniref:ATP-binding cassette domain-containing protein n=1 Tax=Undibacterium sp. GrIS 1.8 TaxID=3143934 RepID=UPI003399F748